MKHTLFSRTVHIACVKTHAILRTRLWRFYAMRNFRCDYSQRKNATHPIWIYLILFSETASILYSILWIYSLRRHPKDRKSGTKSTVQDRLVGLHVFTLTVVTSEARGGFPRKKRGIPLAGCWLATANLSIYYFAEQHSINYYNSDSWLIMLMQQDLEGHELLHNRPIYR